MHCNEEGHIKAVCWLVLLLTVLSPWHTDTTHTMAYWYHAHHDIWTVEPESFTRSLQAVLWFTVCYTLSLWYIVVWPAGLSLSHCSLATPVAGRAHARWHSCRVYGVSSDTLVWLASGLSGHCVQKQCGLVVLCFGGCMALCRTGVAETRL
jgi:hypothetical protein